MTTKPTDYPIDEIAQAMAELSDLGHIAFMKFTCEKCKARLTIREPNTVYRFGECDKCKHVSEIKQANYMAVLVHKPKKPNGNTKETVSD